MLRTPLPAAYGVIGVGLAERLNALRLSVGLDEHERKMRLAYAIRSARERRRITPPQLAERLGVGRGAVNKWESGESVPSLLMLGPLCQALGVDANLFAVLPPIPASPVEDYLMVVSPEERQTLEQIADAQAGGVLEPDESPSGGGKATDSPTQNGPPARRRR